MTGGSNGSINALKALLGMLRRRLAILQGPRNHALERLPPAVHLAWSGRRGSYAFERADLRRESLTRKDLQSANFFGAVMTGIDASGAILDRANMVAVEAGRVDFRAARLNSAALVGANLRDCDFTGADLRHANLTRAMLRGADLRRALLDGAVLRSAIYDERTRWPAGFSPSGSGAVAWRPGEVAPSAAPDAQGQAASPADDDS
jgi:uncharacterized protein YjbI with pentapeptide repeats